MNALAAAAARPAPFLVASDVDGTFINSSERVTPRLARVIRHMLERGTVLTLATGRPARWLKPVLDQLDGYIPRKPLCICSNGAVLFDAEQEEILHSHQLAATTLTHLYEVAMEHVGAEAPVGFGVERLGSHIYSWGDQFVVEPGFDHIWPSEEHSTVSAKELVAHPAIKFFVRSASMSSAALYELMAPHIAPEVGHVSYSWEGGADGGLLEIAPPGVTKKLMLTELAADIGAQPEHIVAFGDMPNDAEMLEWAGFGVAMGNAAPQVKELADAVTASNDEDGVAQVLETWFKP